jgi:shikimate dehydrogenase
MTRYDLALLGDPVAHSRSPALHRAMLELSGLDGDYRAIRADEEVLARTISDLRSGLFQGLNVTMPLKGVAAAMADSLSPPAMRSESVNTLLLDGGTVLGHSTDSTTFEELVDSDRFEADAPVLVLGAGGSARAAMAALQGHRSLFVSARRPGGAAGLATTFGAGTIDWGTAIRGAVVINSTPLGMHGEQIPVPVIGEAGGLIDLPYGSDETPAIATAKSLGLACVDGHEFLLRQAITSFQLWTGARVALDDLVTKLRKV